MTAQEMHIGIDIELQKLNTFATKNILAQEKDWFINKEVLKYINKKINSKANVTNVGFEDTVKRVQDLKELVKTSPTLVTEINDEGNAIVALPSDFYSFVRGDIRLAKNCGVVINNVQTDLYRTEIKINIDVNVLTAYKIEITLLSGLKTIFDFSVDLPTDYIKSIDFKKQAFMLKKALQIVLPKKLKEVLTAPFDLYWEFDKTQFVANTFILYTTDKLFNSVVTFNGVKTNYVGVGSKFDTFNIGDYPIKSNIRMIDDEFYSDAVNSHLSKSTAKSPVSRMSQQSMEIAEIKGFVMGGVKLTYICRPTLSDLLLNSNVNMSRNSLDEILVATVAYIKGVITSPNYEVYKRENILTE